jgi:hypothetical protein
VPVGVGDPASGARRYEALGRVMAALSNELEVLEACRDLAWWQGSGDTWHVEWRDGPYASEVAELLADRIREPDVPCGLVASAEPSTTSTTSTAFLAVMGVTFVVRAIDPYGLRRLRARPGIRRLAEALEPSRRTGTRRHWEELLGG